MANRDGWKDRRKGERGRGDRRKGGEGRGRREREEWEWTRPSSGGNRRPCYLVWYKQVFTDCHPDGKANPRGRRQCDHQEDIDEYRGERDPRYERRSEVKFDCISRLAGKHSAQRYDARQTADGYRDGPPVATT